MRYGTTTSIPGPDVIRRAVEVFGPAGHGLNVVERNLLTVRLEHPAGHVAVEVERRSDGVTELSIETVEFDREVQAFIEKLPRTGAFRRAFDRLFSRRRG